MEEESKRFTREEWLAEGEKRFGKDPKQWQFVCPICGGVQRLQDFIDHKVEEPDAKFYFSCIGRWAKDHKPIKIIDPEERKTTSPCDYTLGGLLRFFQTVVVDEEGNEHTVFEFAPDS